MNATLFRQALKRDWFSNVRPDVLAGTVMALALIPEAIAFSIIAGVDPKVGLYEKCTQCSSLLIFTKGSMWWLVFYHHWTG